MIIPACCESASANLENIKDVMECSWIRKCKYYTDRRLTLPEQTFNTNRRQDVAEVFLETRNADVAMFERSTQKMLAR
jgi:hypothetical protein